MQKPKIVFTSVNSLYSQSTTSMGKWMWQHHTQWVASKAIFLAKKYNANATKTYCAAMLHDIADCKYERDEKDFETWGWQTAKTILKDAGFRHQERKDIMEAMRTHACHPGHLPTTLEAKILSTADAMWHLQTSFFPEICYMNRPNNTSSYKEWQTWFLGKIERDFTAKIFFKDECNEVKDDYTALKKVFCKQPFSNKT